ncbi:MAG TPA: acyl-CoA dehydrogenase family protein [Sporichthyaceae bacterium]|jgi:alkylation response protein AidB-like acyl-CoA dehydrogenase|nr:acyl-CoA dehydrogenase family protein [Sporichthyaceae bacterium]
MTPLAEFSDPPIPDLLESDVEGDLRATVRDLLDKRAGWPDVLARTESDEPVDSALWAALCEIGCAGLSVPVSSGGAGASWTEAAVVAEELGRSIAPVPFLGHSMAVAALAALGESELLPALASGERSGVLAVPFASSPGRIAAVADGAVDSVADACVAEVLLLFAGFGAGATLWAVEARAVDRRAVVSLDMTRPLVDLRSVEAGQVLAKGAAAQHAVDHALRIGAVLLAAEQVGLANRVLEMTVEYVGSRRQFARVVGSYQALKHRMADLWVALTQARAAARYAAVCAATGAPDLPVAAALAQARCSPVAQRAAEECIQLHGGIGFTWEHPAHLYLKRAVSDSIALGTAERHRAILADLLDLPGPMR